jgi:hypothetical protein
MSASLPLAPLVLAAALGAADFLLNFSRSFPESEDETSALPSAKRQ